MLINHTSVTDSGIHNKDSDSKRENVTDISNRNEVSLNFPSFPAYQAGTGYQGHGSFKELESGGGEGGVGERQSQSK